MRRDPFSKGAHRDGRRFFLDGWAEPVFSAGAFRMEEGVGPIPRGGGLPPLLKTSRGMICLADPAGMDGAKNPFCGPKRTCLWFPVPVFLHSGPDLPYTDFERFYRMDGGPGGFVMRHETVDLIFNAAIEVFAESGFDQAKMDDIARAAGVAKGTIYYHFRSKEELFVGLMNEGVQKLIDRARQYLKLHKSPTDQLLALVENQIHFYVQNGKLAKLLLNEAFGTKTRQVQFRRKIGEYLQLIEEVMIEGNRLGEFQIKHVPETASAIFGAASVVVLQKLYSMEEVDPARIERDIPPMVETVRRMVLYGIKDSTYC